MSEHTGDPITCPLCTNSNPRRFDPCQFHVSAGGTGTWEIEELPMAEDLYSWGNPDAKGWCYAEMDSHEGETHFLIIGREMVPNWLRAGGYRREERDGVTYVMRVAKS